MDGTITMTVDVTSLRAVREIRRMTLSELARKIGVNQGDLSRLETGQLVASAERLERIMGAYAEALNLPIDEAWRLAPYERVAVA